MKYVIGVISTVIIGLGIGYLGVLTSIFSYGSIEERLITTAVLLFIYFILGILFGFLLPKAFWQMALLLTGGADYTLIRCMIEEFDYFYAIYLILIIAVTFYGSCIGYRYSKKVNDIK